MTTPIKEIARGLHPSWAEVDERAWRWPHFSPRELACKCGRHCRGEYFHDPEFLDNLEALRAEVMQPLKITSGRRCARHNTAVGGASRSEHKLHIAGDISLNGHMRAVLARAAVKVGFTGIGFGKGFLHVDQRSTTRVAWNYTPDAAALWKSAFGFDPVAKLKRAWSL